jgi:hypothetical protein
LDKAKKQVKAGDILVFHDNKKSKDRLKVLLPETLKIIQEKQLNFNILSD